MTTPDDAAVRITANQKRAAMHVLDNRNAYPTMDELGEAIALAVVCAEDPNSRRVVAVLEPAGAFYIFGPYATHAAASKAAETGLATREGARGGVFPLIPVPRSPATAQQIKPTRKTAGKKREMS